MYLNIKKNQPLDLGKDCTSFENWMKSTKESFSCAIHKDGYLVFLEPEKIESSNEYREGDPYKVSENIDSNFQKRRFRSTITLLKSIQIISKARILDLGCGEGHLTKNILETFPKCEVHGLDYSIAAIEIANKNYKGIKFIVADGYEPPYVNEYFDIVVLNNIWEHVPDPMRMLNGIARVLKKNGHIIISTPSRYRFKNLIKVLRGQPISFMSKLHVTEYSVGQLKEQLKFGGYTVETVYSETIKENKFFIHFIKLIIKFFLKRINSHHHLESTVFYLATKR